MDKPLISVIVPIYKVEEYFDECISSIVHQTYENLEIILVDDGSPDKCPQLCDEWARRDKRIKVIHKQNGGLSSARNAGLDIVSGEYFGFVDSDDFIHNKMYETLLSYFTSDNIAIVSCGINKYYLGEPRVFKELWDRKTVCKIGPEEFACKIIGQENSYTVWNKLYKTNDLKSVRFLEGRNNEDTLYMYEISKEMQRKNLCMLDIPFTGYYYRYRENSICTSSKIPLIEDVVKNQDYILNDCRTRDSELYSIVYKLKAKRIIFFLDSILTKPEWRKIYYSKYKALLNEIPSKFLLTEFSLKMNIIVFLLMYFPSVRKFLKHDS